MSLAEHKHYPISLSEVLRAKRFVYDYLTPTPLIHYENHNPTGTFKIRGGINLLHHLKGSKVDGVITFSTGNHGLSIAQSATWLGLEATIVVPENNNPVKNRSIKSTGAILI